MRIDDCLPKPEDYLANELETLKYIQRNQKLNEYFGKLIVDARNYESQIKSILKCNIQNKEKKITFESDFSIKIDNNEGFAYFGSIIFLKNLNEYNGVSYYLALISNHKEKIIRKFHFDYSNPNISRKKSHLVFHLQYPGELTNTLKSLNAKCDHLDCWLSEPRLYYTPMSLALLINIILTEFEDEKNHNILQTTEWRKMIKENETFLLMNYYKCCYDFLSSEKPKLLFTNDFCYRKNDSDK